LPNAVLTVFSIRRTINPRRNPSGLLADKGGAAQFQVSPRVLVPFVIHRPLERAQIGTAKRMFAEIIAGDVSLLVTFNHAIDGLIQSNPKARANPKALAQLDGYKRPLVGSFNESSAVRNGESCQNGEPAENHRRDDE